DYDLRLDVPSKELGSAASYAQGLLAKIPGLNLAMPDVFSFVFKVKGTMAKPQVTLSKVVPGGSSGSGANTNTVQDLKKQAEDLAKQKADEAKKQAEQQAAQAKQQAEQKAKEAADKAKKAAQDAADKAKKDAEQKAKDLFKLPH
ncbi:MAG TPA: hypothetical protein VG603_06330, partial [Chitinophagales bacterium]|nr:hypothetical protein [Chitinophagales bacterium]